MTELPSENVPRALDALVDWQEGSIVSRVLVKTAGGSLTVFAFDAAQSLSEHTVPNEALILVLDGAAGVTVGGERHAVRAGESIRLPANVPHAVEGPERFKMLLAILKA
jgi:quercetin dioxygenase-like cupin family protein